MQQATTLLRHPAQPPLDDAAALTALCKATADDLRLRILRILRNDSLGVLEMARVLDIRQTALSHHLKILATAGLLSTRREGNAIFYRRVFLRADDPLLRLTSALFETVDRLILDANCAARLQQIKQEREQQSRDFFARFADRFQQNQDLVAGTAQYAAPLLELLGELRLSGSGTVLEIGPGEGELLPALAGVFTRVIALDNSAEMLERARSRVQAAGAPGNIEFVHGDTAAAVAQDLRANLIIVGMVLHHVSSPAEIFADCARLLAPGGALLVAELCSHNQDWVRDNCGDLWLGFEPEELSHWGQRAGFDSGQSLYLGLKNGFQIQIRLFHKKSAPEGGGSPLLY